MSETPEVVDLKTIKLSNGKLVTIKPLTRNIRRAMDAEMFKGVMITAGETSNTTSIPAINGANAEELAICLLCDMTMDEVGDLLMEDYELLKTAVNKATEGKKKK